MQAPSLIVLAVAIFATSLPAADSIKDSRPVVGLKDGRTLHDFRIVTLNSSGALVRSREGATTIPYPLLPDDLLAAIHQARPDLDLLASARDQASNPPPPSSTSLASTDVQPPGARTPIADAGNSGAKTGRRFELGRRIDIPVGEDPDSLVATDVDGNGHVDLVVANQGGRAVHVLLGDGKGKLVEPDLPPALPENFSHDLCVGDINGDGKPDLIVATLKMSAVANVHIQTVTATIRRTVGVLLGDGKGGFKFNHAAAIEEGFKLNTHCAISADFDGDGTPDLVVDSWLKEKVTLFRGDRAGGFNRPSLPLSLASLSRPSLCAADFNGDGHPDLAATDYATGSVYIALNDGTGQFSMASGSPFPCGATPLFVAAGDLDGDGKTDLVVVNFSDEGEQSSDGITVLRGNGSGGFKIAADSPIAAGHGPRRVVVADMNGDRVPDLVVLNKLSADVTILYAQGATYARGPSLPVGNQPRTIAVADFNEDGHPDIAVSNSANNSVTVLFGR